MLRREDLCDGPGKCQDPETGARAVECQTCHAAWEPPDIRMPDFCPNCQGRRYIRLPCDTCPALKLDAAINERGLGPLIGRAQEIDTMLNKGISLGPDEITMQEYAVLQIIWSERDKYLIEQQKNEIARLQANAHKVPTRR